MIPVDLSANCEGWIYDPNRSWTQILWVKSRDPRPCLAIAPLAVDSTLNSIAPASVNVKPTVFKPVLSVHLRVTQLHIVYVFSRPQDRIFLGSRLQVGKLLHAIIFTSGTQI